MTIEINQEQPADDSASETTEVKEETTVESTEVTTETNSDDD